MRPPRKRPYCWTSQPWRSARSETRKRSRSSYSEQVAAFRTRQTAKAAGVPAAFLLRLYYYSAELTQASNWGIWGAAEIAYLDALAFIGALAGGPCAVVLRRRPWRPAERKPCHEPDLTPIAQASHGKTRKPAPLASRRRLTEDLTPDAQRGKCSTKYCCQAAMCASSASRAGWASRVSSASRISRCSARAC